MPLPCQNKKKKENQKKRTIKSRKIDKRKRKMLVFKYTITHRFSDIVLVIKYQYLR